MRLIDADELVKAVEKEHIFIRPHDDPYDVVREQGKRLKKCVINAPTVEQPRWIPVEERLPKTVVNKVIVFCQNGYIGYGHYEDYKGRQEWYNLESGEPFRAWNQDRCEPYEVTHWMPLPEPPKED